MTVEFYYHMIEKISYCQMYTGVGNELTSIK